MANLFHRIGDRVAAIAARFEFALAALTGKFPLPTPLERKTIMTIFERLAAAETRLAALETGATETVSIATAASTAASAASINVADLSVRLAVIETEVGTPAPVEAAA